MHRDIEQARREFLDWLDEHRPWDEDDTEDLLDAMKRIVDAAERIFCNTTREIP